MISRRLTSLGATLVFVGYARAPKAAGVEYAIGDCLTAAWSTA